MRKILGTRETLKLVHSNIFNDGVMFKNFKRLMMTKFDMSDRKKLHYFLNFEVVQSNARVFILKKKYVQKVLDKSRMKNYNSTSITIEFGLKLNKNHEGKHVDDTLYN